MAAHARALGIRCVECDTEMADTYGVSEQAFDVAHAAFVQPTVDAIRGGVITSMHGAGNCDTFSVARLGGGRGKRRGRKAAVLRTRESPEMAPACPTDSRDRVSRENDTWRSIARLALEVFEAGGEFTIEAPPDRGEGGGRLRRKRWQAHVPVWLLPCIKALQKLTGAQLLVFPQCALRSRVPYEYQKETAILASPRIYRKLAHLDSRRCEHDTHPKVAFGVTEDGVFKSKAAAPYADGLNRVLAWAHAQFGGRMSEEAAREHRAHPWQPQVPTWTSAVDSMPEAWDERAYARGDRLEEARKQRLRYVSKRRAEPEREEVLASRPFPTPHAPCPTVAKVPPPSRGWPAGAPPRPISIFQLYDEGVVEGEMLPWIDQGAARVRELEGGERCGKLEAATWGPERQPEWARGTVWDCEDWLDCVPVVRSTAEEPPPQDVRPEFFTTWAPVIGAADWEMVRQIQSGVECGSDIEYSSSFRFHHGGLRENFEPARASIERDAEPDRGWILRGRRMPRFVPTRAVARNCVKHYKWKLVVEEGKRIARQALKWRVTTDDSAEGPDTDSRNASMRRDEWVNLELPSPTTFAEALAIAKAIDRSYCLELDCAALERVAQWVIDLSDAYRMLGVQRDEVWMQGLVWSDGLRYDMRCVFGAAHMVQFFERVSSFVLRVAQYRIARVDALFPYSAARQAWIARRARQLGGVQRAEASFIYLDDTWGLCVLEADEPIEAAAGEPPSRIQRHVGEVSGSFEEAGWRIQVVKVVLADEVEALGLLVDAAGEGAIACTEARRRGLLVELAGQQCPDSADGSVPFKLVEQLVGRLGHISQVEPASNLALGDLWPSRAAGRRLASGKRITPGRVRVGASAVYQRGLQWWKGALENGVFAPLAARAEFPRPGDAGCVVAFTDAARELGTGRGGFAPVIIDGRLTFLYAEARWPEELRRALIENRLSMPAGELFGLVVLCIALAKRLPRATHMILFTDSDPAAVAVNTNSSGSQQMGALLRKLNEHVGGLQLLALHIPGVLNGVSDRLSRDGTAAVLDEARRAGFEIEELGVEPDALEWMREAELLPQGNA